MGSHGRDLALLGCPHPHPASQSSRHTSVMSWSGIELYYTPGSPHCRAVLMCISALELEVDLIKLDMYQKYEHKKPWFVKMNPQHTVPTINDNDFILWESRAILSYLVNKYGQEEPRKSQLYPADPEQRALVDRLLFFDNGTLYKNIVDYFHPQLMSGEEADERKANALKQSLDYLEKTKIEIFEPILFKIHLFELNKKGNHDGRKRCTELR